VTAPVHLDNGVIGVTVAPGLGGTILDVVHLPSGLSALGRVPWVPDLTPPAGVPMSEADWLPHYTGGWPILFPNGGEACVIDGVAHGFHGEGSLAVWSAVHAGEGLTLTCDFRTVPVRMTRQLRLEGASLVVTTEALASAPCAVIWGEHVTLGGDLLAAPFHIACGPAVLRADPDYDPAGNPVFPGATGVWPHLPGRHGGTVDLSRPAEGWAALAYLSGFDRPEVTVARDDGRLAATVAWEGGVFDCLWLWVELAATTAPPWSGQARLLGVEPCSTPAGHGLAQARANGDRLLHLLPGRPVRTVTRLTLAA